jgi:hypothetical protein
VSECNGFPTSRSLAAQASVISLHQPNKRFTRPRGRRTVGTLRDSVACRVRIALASWIAPEGHRADRQFAAPVVPSMWTVGWLRLSMSRKVASADDLCTLNGELSPLSSPYNSA